MKLRSVLVALFTIVGAVTSVHAVPIVLTFESLAVGTTLSNQFAALGVTFSPNAFSGAVGPTKNWATNTDMTIVSSTGADVGGLGTPSLVSGNIVHSFSGWLSENGYASIDALFSTAISSISIDFAGVSTPSSTRMFIYNGATLLATVAGSASTGQFELSYSAPLITRVAFTPGDFDDWVGFDNFTYTQVAATPPNAVPEPGSLALLGLGLAGLAAVRRRKSS